MKSKLMAVVVMAIMTTANQASVIILGDAINLGFSNSVTDEYGAVFGHNNNVGQLGGLVIGAYNELSMEDNDYGSFVLGHHNFGSGYGSIIGGSYNTCWDSSSITMGYLNHNNAPCSIVVGHGNVADYTPNQDSVVAGRYNAAIPNNKPAHLVIGNGTHNEARKNSFIVYADGDIVITKPQGDISMGIYE